MIYMFTKEDINKIEDEYSRYISNTIKISKSTSSQYEAIIKGFLRNSVLNKVEQNNYESIFSDDNIAQFRNIRKSVIVRSALNHLLKYFISKDLIAKGTEINFHVNEITKHQSEFLSKEEMSYIFTDCKFDDKIERLFSRAICALSAFCFFEQKHIRALRLQDIDGDLIRNLRYDDNNAKSSHLTRWIKLNQLTQQCLNDYINEYRNSLDTDEETFFIFDGSPFGDDFYDVNKWLLFSKRTANKDMLKGLNIYNLVASSILYLLIVTKGKSISEILQIIEIGNQQFNKAFIHYMIYYSEVENFTGIVTIEEFDSIEIKYRQTEESLTKLPEEYDKDQEENEDIFTVAEKYSLERDFTMNDILNFDSINNQNLINKEVVINRLVRDTNISKKLKKIYNNRCQLCGYQLRSSNGEYMSEAHHIKPYNKTHQGDDTFGNLIVLCPNCHAQFDELFYAIDPVTYKVNCLFD